MSSFFADIEDPSSQYTWPRLIYSALRVPAYHFYFEVLLLIGIIWLGFKRSYKIVDKVELSDEEKNQLIEEWEPQPIVPKTWTPSPRLLSIFNRAAVGVVGKYVQFATDSSTNKNGYTPLHLNVATLNFLNFIGDEELKEVALKALRKYGMGSCGPRGFYGTFDVHLTLETTLAAFLGVEEVALYSYGFSTIASAIPAYAKRTDVIFADAGVSQAIHQGLLASRSTIKYFRHNDMQHLESLLVEQALEDLKDAKRASTTRRFFVVEGIYLNSGDICNLPKLVELKYKYKVRIMLEESISFGVLGSNGRGITEYYGISIDNIDFIAGSLETAVGICGGFCAGSHYVVDHQRLSGQGYCFSASLPPLLAVAGEVAIDRLVEENGIRQRRLLKLSHKLHEALTGTSVASTYWTIEGHIDSPMKHIRLTKNNNLDRLEKAVDMASNLSFLDASLDLENKTSKPPVLLTVARHLFDQSPAPIFPSIRLALNCSLADSELSHICFVLTEIGKKLASDEL